MMQPACSRASLASPRGARGGATGFADRTESTPRHRDDARGDDLLRLGARTPASKGDVIPDLPARPDLGQLRRQAKELLAAARHDDDDARARRSA